MKLTLYCCHATVHYFDFFMNKVYQASILSLTNLWRNYMLMLFTETSW